MTPTSSRARSREQRSAHIEQVALELFRSRGFDHVTVEDVCAEAGVGPATFYRHFGTKEGVVFSYQESFATAVRTALDAAGALPEPARLEAVLRRFAEVLEAQSEMLASRDQIVLGNARLLQRTLLVQREWEAQLAEGLARLRGLPGPDGRAQLQAGVGLVVLRVAVRSWRSGGAASLPEAVGEALAGMQGLLSGQPPGRHPGEPGA